MTAQSFRELSDRLVSHLKALIRSGELTERGLARLVGYSQPHVHNVLAGVRGVNMRFADDVLRSLGITLEELATDGDQGTPLNHIRVPMCSGELSSNRGFPKESEGSSVILVPADAVATATGSLAMRVGADEDAMWPTIRPGDLVVIDSSPRCRVEPDVAGVYVLRVGGRGVLRRCQRVGSRLLTISDHATSGEPSSTWIALERKKILDIVRGRVVWMSRRLEEDLD